MVATQDNDTIVASATAPGVAGIGIVRISGNNIPTYLKEIINDELDPRKASYKSFYENNSHCYLISHQEILLNKLIKFNKWSLKCKIN